MRNNLVIAQMTLLIALLIGGQVVCLGQASGARDDDQGAKQEDQKEKSPKTPELRNVRPSASGTAPPRGPNSQFGGGVNSTPRSDTPSNTAGGAALPSDTNSGVANLSKGVPANNSSKNRPETVEEETWLWYVLRLFLIGLPVVLIVGGVVWGILYLRRNNERERGEIRAGFSDLRTKNSSLSQKIETLTKITTDLSQQIAQQKSEISGLKRNMSDSPAMSYPPPPPIAAVPKEQPRFPVSVTDYLAKVGQGATSVKYDYKEGMLVTDSTNEGGLTIVHDEGRIYLIPSFGFFQTKSDYINYFERYYTCARPMGGNVWILQPASVSQVAGGWQLASPGELEVR